MMTKNFYAEESSAKNVAERWRKQFQKGDGAWVGGQDEKYDKLLELGECPNIEDVNKIIGNQSWTRPWCSVHSGYVDKVIVVGEDSYQRICCKCLREINKEMDVEGLERAELSRLREKYESGK